jgi:hypothetical protein
MIKIPMQPYQVKCLENRVLISAAPPDKLGSKQVILFKL